MSNAFRINQYAFAAVLAATLLTFLVAESYSGSFSNGSSKALISAAMITKFCVIAYFFMDLRKAHFIYALSLMSFIMILGTVFAFLH